MVVVKAYSKRDVTQSLREYAERLGDIRVSSPPLSLRSIAITASSPSQNPRTDPPSLSPFQVHSYRTVRISSALMI